MRTIKITILQRRHKFSSLKLIWIFIHALVFLSWVCSTLFIEEIKLLSIYQALLFDKHRNLSPE